MLHPTAAASARPSSASSPDWPKRTTVALVAVGAQQDHAVGEGRDPVACELEVERRPAALGRLTHERLQRVERLGGHARPPGPLVPGPDLADDPLVDHREPGRAQERLPLRPSIGADVGGVATPLDLRDERVGGGEALEVVASRVARARHVGRGARTELRLDATGVGVAHVRLARSARWRKRKSVSSGERSKRREASSRSLTRSAAGSSRSRSSIHFTACLIGASPAAIAGLLRYLPLVSRSNFVFHSLLRSSTPGMYLMVDHVARAAPRIAYMRVSLISSSVAPACFAAAKRPGTQDVQPAAAIAASATSCIVFGSSAPSR